MHDHHFLEFGVDVPQRVHAGELGANHLPRRVDEVDRRRKVARRQQQLNRRLRPAPDQARSTTALSNLAEAILLAAYLMTVCTSSSVLMSLMALFRRRCDLIVVMVWGKDARGVRERTPHAASGISLTALISCSCRLRMCVRMRLMATSVRPTSLYRNCAHIIGDQRR